eukprot:5606842-Pleurochrysis_carterae.AAC.4
MGSKPEPRKACIPGSCLRVRSRHERTTCRAQQRTLRGRRRTLSTAVPAPRRSRQGEAAPPCHHAAKASDRRAAKLPCAARARRSHVSPSYSSSASRCIGAMLAI